MLSKRSTPAISRALSAAGVLAVAAFVVMRSGSDEAPPLGNAAAPPVAPAPPPVAEPAAAQPADAVGPIAEAPGPTPTPTPPQPERPPGYSETDMKRFWACIRALNKIHPLVGAADAAQLEEIEARKKWAALGRRLAVASAVLDGKEPPAAEPAPVEEVPCPEGDLRAMYERARQYDLQLNQR